MSRKKDVRSVVYLCDGKACEEPDFCMFNGTGECRHTTDLEHALHKDIDISSFIAYPIPGEGKVDLWEPFDGE